MANLFVYGSLQFADVLLAVTGLLRRAEPAQLAQHRVRCVRGATYPALVHSPGDVAQGKLYRGLAARTLRRLDVFEGAWYVRRRVVVSTARGRTMAYVYVWQRAQRKRLADTAWDAAVFDDHHRRRFAAYWRRYPPAATVARSSFTKNIITKPPNSRMSSDAKPARWL